MQVVTAGNFSAQFTANPAGFLDSNLVTFNIGSVTIAQWNQLTQAAVVPGQMTPADAHHPIRFAMNRYTQAQDNFNVQGLNGANGDMYSLAINQNGDAAAYLLPWVTDGGYFTILGDDADLFFNASMSGCALGWTVRPDGSVRIGHANIQGGNTTDEQQMRTALMTVYQNCLLPSQYRGVKRDQECNVVGVRTPSGWRLYAQIFTGGAGNYAILGVDRLL